MERDPVCGMNVGANSPKSPYNGATYYFCCTGCKGTFDKNPKKFVK